MCEAIDMCRTWSLETRKRSSYFLSCVLLSIVNTIEAINNLVSRDMKELFKREQLSVGKDGARQCNAENKLREKIAKI